MSTDPELYKCVITSEVREYHLKSISWHTYMVTHNPKYLELPWWRKMIVRLHLRLTVWRMKIAELKDKIS